MFSRGFLIALICILTYPSAVESVYCYTCNSAFNPECSDSYRLSYSGLYQDCSSTNYGYADGCLKVTGPLSVISRQCAGQSVGAYQQADGCFINGNVQTCVCTSSYCNAAYRAGLPSTGVLASFLFLTLKFLFL